MPAVPICQSTAEQQEPAERQPEGRADQHQLRLIQSQLRADRRQRHPDQRDGEDKFHLDRTEQCEQAAPTRRSLPGSGALGGQGCQDRIAWST